MEIVYRWFQRARLWAIVTGGIFAAVAIGLYGPDGHPSGVPAWMVGSVVGVIGLPSLSMLVVGCVYLARSRCRHRRRSGRSVLIGARPRTGFVGFPQPATVGA